MCIARAIVKVRIIFIEDEAVVGERGSKKALMEPMVEIKDYLGLSKVYNIQRQRFLDRFCWEGERKG